MANPRPMPVVRLRAKIETSVRAVTTRRTRNVPRTARAPTASGNPAATAEPKTSTSTRSVIGSVIASARRRSRWAWSSIWRNTSPAPPSSAVTGPAVTR